MTEPLTLLLVRHGQSVWNEAGLIQGQTRGVPLTQRGHAQADRTGRALARLTPGALISSDLLRATQTADHCARRTGHTYSTSTSLREQGYGVLEGRPLRDLEGIAGRCEVAWAAEGGENRVQLYQRVRGFLRQLLADPPADIVALVTHGDTIRAAHAVISGSGPESLPEATPRNGSITRLVIRPHDALASRAAVDCCSR